MSLTNDEIVEQLKHQAAQDQAQIHNLQLRLANAVARAEKAEAELKALADREPIAWEWWGNKSELWFQCSDKDQAIQYIEEGRKVRAIYASPIIAATPTLHRDATRVIAAWDSTVLPKSHDGRLQQEMECLRESLGADSNSAEFDGIKTEHIPQFPFVYMKLCPICGNKRCPKAESSVYKCTGSNDVGQIGELEHTPQLGAVGGAAYPIPAEWRDFVRVVAEYNYPNDYPSLRGVISGFCYAARRLLERAK